MPRHNLRKQGSDSDAALPLTRGYQQELLEESLKSNIIIALPTGSGKTHIAILRIRAELDKGENKVSWFLCPTVALCEQQHAIISTILPKVGLILGYMEPDKWLSRSLWDGILSTHNVVVSTPAILLDALHHGYVVLQEDISLLIFDEAHHAVENNPYNRIMHEFYYRRGRPPLDPSTVPNGHRNPSILGLTASPLLGLNVQMSLAILEKNLDARVRTAQLNDIELQQYVHRPQLQFYLYESLEFPLFRDQLPHNLRLLHETVETLPIDADPSIKSLRSKIASLSRTNTMPGTIESLNEKLAKAVLTKNTFTHKNLRALMYAADEIYKEMGVWGCEWYISKSLEQARDTKMRLVGKLSKWPSSDFEYFIRIVDELYSRLVIPSVTDQDFDAEGVCSVKVKALIDALVSQKAASEATDESFSGLIFVERRDAVIVLTEILSRHPLTASPIFRCGSLVGASDDARRRTVFDLQKNFFSRNRSERGFADEPSTSNNTSDDNGLINSHTSKDTLAAFGIGLLNVLICTSVAEEGLDIRACNNVIRFDPPKNVRSWAQSRGRARKERSVFTILVDDSQPERYAEWMEVELAMERGYKEEKERNQRYIDSIKDAMDETDDSDEHPQVFEVPETGATVSLNSAVAHLNHFSNCLPQSVYFSNAPVYSFTPEQKYSISSSGAYLPPPPSLGPFGATVTLSSLLPHNLRTFTTPQEHRTKYRAKRAAAFKAYVQLYKAGLLNDHLLPLMEDMEIETEAGVREILKQEIEKRDGFAKVLKQIDPWLYRRDQSDATREDAEQDDDSSEQWWESTITVEGLATLRLISRVDIAPAIQGMPPYIIETPTIKHPLVIHSIGPFSPHDRSQLQADLEKARLFTRRLFWSRWGGWMRWNNLDFSVVFLPLNGEFEPELQPYHILSDLYIPGREYLELHHGTIPQHPMLLRAGKYRRPHFTHAMSHERISTSAIVKMALQFDEVDPIPNPPYIVAKHVPRRTTYFQDNFSDGNRNQTLDLTLVPPEGCTIDLLPPELLRMSTFLPCILRALTLGLTAAFALDDIISKVPESSVPVQHLPNISIPLMTVAITAPVSHEPADYQRMETLGDSVLKFLTCLELLVEHDAWHEGYLSKAKDHTVSNARLSRAAIERCLPRFIIREVFLGRKWRPPVASMPTEEEEDENDLLGFADPSISSHSAISATHESAHMEMSTKTLADVVESIIAACHLSGGLDCAVEFLRSFLPDERFTWMPIINRVETIVERVNNLPWYPAQLNSVERLIEYQFEHRSLLMEALCHASYQGAHDMRSSAAISHSYDRLEFLGDSLLDLLVVEWLYKYSGEDLAPGQMHPYKICVVNSHFLGFLALDRSNQETTKKVVEKEGDPQISEDVEEVYLWQSMLHSSPMIMDHQAACAVRFQKERKGLHEAFERGTKYPWAALTRLQAYKFFGDMVESIIGAVYLDSGGSLEIVSNLLTHLGIFRLLERLVVEKVDIRHPVSTLFERTSTKLQTLDYDVVKENGMSVCVINVDGKRIYTHTEPGTDDAAKEAAKTTGAERALEILQ
ncbi:P-loop containing nucleoside triphosphate hydrolase protein [Sistotremastrum niveocremeum HHB9708]|uniref:p-loop containing nucleoside triphosphate hydrolase protein n=1 Tax=Sistotremastrum niveocremeum HHB9708 TaxID=1314777 RepID=A0A164Y3F2_9AGAM|nr:P-loop containing nucleoside triphosphate hydrolase protein [Sistotremastrum niveocremeum HHB9708]